MKTMRLIVVAMLIMLLLGCAGQKATVERTEAGAEGGGVSGEAAKPGALLVYEHDTLNSRAILCALTVQACRSASHGRRLPTA